MPSPPPRLTWQYFAGTATEATAAASADIEENLRIVGAVVINAGPKRGAVDVMLKSRVAAMLLEQRDVPAEVKASHVVVIASGDRDFAHEVRGLQLEGLRVGVLCNEQARDAYVGLADMYGLWPTLLAAASGRGGGVSIGGNGGDTASTGDASARTRKAASGSGNTTTSARASCAWLADSWPLPEVTWCTWVTLIQPIATVTAASAAYAVRRSAGDRQRQAGSGAAPVRAWMSPCHAANATRGIHCMLPS